jgi:hypothetical protein
MQRPKARCSNADQKEGNSNHVPRLRCPNISQPTRIFPVQAILTD